MVVISSDMFGKKVLSTGMLHWIRDHDLEIESWAEKTLEESSSYEFLSNLFSSRGNDMLKLLTYQLFKQRASMHYNSGIMHIANKLTSKFGQIYAITGAKGGGKTVLAFSLAAECADSGIDVYYYGIPTELPPFFKKATTDWNTIPNNSIILIDEASILFFNRRNDKSNFDMIEQLPVLRHGSKNIIFVTQNTAIVDINLIRLCDGLLFKSWSVIQDKTERQIFAPELKYFMPQKKNECLFCDNEEVLSFSHDLPDWWLPQYSTTFKPFENKEQAIISFLLLLKERPAEEALMLLSLRNPPLSRAEIDAVTRFSDYYGDEFVDQLLDSGATHRLPDLINGFITETPIDKIKDDDIGAPIKTYKYEVPYEVRKDWESRQEDTKRNIDVCINREIRREIFNSVDNKNFVAGFVGYMGSGKSYSMLAMGNMISQHTLHRNINVDNVHFSGETFLDGLRGMTPQDVIFRDEVITSFGIGSHRTDDEIENAIETLRKAQINFLFASPQLKITAELLKFIFSVYGIDKSKGVAKVLVFRPDQYPRYPDGYITLSLPLKVIRDKYDPKAIAYTTKVVERKTNERNYELLAEKAMAKANKDHMYLNSRLEWEAYIRTVYPNHNTSEIKEIGTWCMMKIRQDQGVPDGL